MGTNNRITTLSYDLAGNQLSDGTYAMAWDAESRMKSYSTINYTYDGDGRRTKKSSGKLYWYRISGDVLAESDLGGTISDEFIFFGGKRIARRASSGSVFYYLGNHLGTSRVIVQAGQNTACYEADYEPFGKERIVTNSCPHTYKFTGKERDTESNLDYFGARYFAAAHGRFIAVDAAGPDLNRPQSLNRYRYALNNPLRFVDPDGLYESDVHLDLTIVLAEAAGYDAQTARSIGLANQRVDDDPATDSTRPMNFGARRDFHFTDPERRNALWNEFAADPSARSLGTYLHTLQDSYAHQGYGHRDGHRSAGTAPDITANNPGRANQMAQDTYGRLVTSVAIKQAGRSSSFQSVSWDKLSPLVNQFNRARNETEKRKALDAIKKLIEAERRRAEEAKKKAEEKRKKKEEK